MKAFSIDNLTLYNSTVYLILGLLFLDGIYLVYKNYSKYTEKRDTIKGNIKSLNDELDLKKEKYKNKKEEMQNELDSIIQSLGMKVADSYSHIEKIQVGNGSHSDIN